MELTKTRQFKAYTLFMTIVFMIVTSILIFMSLGIGYDKGYKDGYSKGVQNTKQAYLPDETKKEEEFPPVMSSKRGAS